MNYLEEYYRHYDEEGRLLRRYGQVEYLTTMKYIHDLLQGDKSRRIIEIGAGTGRYSVALAREGYPVTAVELITHNLEILPLFRETSMSCWIKICLRRISIVCLSRRISLLWCAWRRLRRLQSRFRLNGNDWWQRTGRPALSATA